MSLFGWSINLIPELDKRLKADMISTVHVNLVVFMFVLVYLSSYM